jgi:acetyl-CoA acetyltransferase
LRSLDSLKALEKAAERLYEKTGINPKQIDFAEIDDRFSYREYINKLNIAYS